MTPEVSILMETSLRISRGLLQGVIDYTRSNGPWKIRYTAGGMRDQLLPPDWDGDGVLARVNTPALARQLMRYRGPMVLFDLQEHYLPASCTLSRVPRIVNDYAACGRLAADYFLDRGYRHFAFFSPTLSSAPGLEYDGTGLAEPNWSRERCEGFVGRLAEKGFPCAVYPTPQTARGSHDFGREQKRIARWLASQPKPIAVFAAHDARGVQVVEACNSSGLAVPSEVAVLGVNNDELLCETCAPSLSSIALDSIRAGFMAAEMLDRLMRGERSAPTVTRYQPLCVETRGSTFGFGSADPLVAQALARIEETNGFRIHPASLADELNVSRRWLERRFKKTLGKGVAQLIRETMLNHVRRLVQETDIPFQKLAADAGIATSAHLSVLFRRHFGTTMSAVRHSHAVPSHCATRSPERARRAST